MTLGSKIRCAAVRTGSGVGRRSVIIGVSRPPVHHPAPRKMTRHMPRADREEVIDAFLDLADTITTVRSLTRQGFVPPGPNGSGQLVAHPREAWARAGHPETWWPSNCPARISGVTSCRSPGRGGSTRRWCRRPGIWHSRVRRCPGAASKAREPCEIGFAAVAAACVRRRRCPGRAAPRHRASRVRRPGSPAGGRRSRSRG